MVESFVMIQEDYKKVYQIWTEITDSEADEITDEEIICDDMYFEDSNGWCLITTRCGDNFAEEVLLQLSAGKKLLYFFSDEDQLDCEFLVIENNKIIRKNIFIMMLRSWMRMKDDCSVKMSMSLWNGVILIILLK